MGKKKDSKTSQASSPKAAAAKAAPSPSKAPPQPSPQPPGGGSRKAPPKVAEEVADSVAAAEPPRTAPAAADDRLLVADLEDRLRGLSVVADVVRLAGREPSNNEDTDREVAVEFLRSYAAALLAFLSDRFLHGSSGELYRDASSRSLLADVEELPSTFRSELSAILQQEASAPAVSMCETLLAIGAYMVVGLLPNASLTQLARGLNVPPPRTTDPDVFRDTMAQAVALKLVPEVTPPLPLVIISHVTVDETAPGKYTCVVGNARLMCMVPRLCCPSVKFAFMKVPWRLAVSTKDGKASVSMWHRSPNPVAVRLSLTVEDVDTRPKRVRRSSVTQTVEGQIVASEAIGFDDAAHIADIANRTATAYNAIEDEVSFTLEIESLPVTKMSTLEDLVAEEEEERQRKAQQKARLKGDKRDKAKQIEGDGREKPAAAAAATAAAAASVSPATPTAPPTAAVAAAVASPASDADGKRARAQGKKKDKRAAEETTDEGAPKVEIDIELEARVLQLQKVIQTTRSAVSKLANERHKEDKELQRLGASLVERRAEIVKLQAAADEGAVQNNVLTAEVAKLTERRRWLEEQRRQREEHRRSMAFSDSTSLLPMSSSAPFTGYQWSERTEKSATSASPSQGSVAVEGMGTPAHSFPNAAANPTGTMPVAQPPPPRRMVPPPRSVAAQHGTPPSQPHSRQGSQSFTSVPLPRSAELRQATPTYPSPAAPPSNSPPPYLPTNSPFGWSAFQ